MVDPVPYAARKTSTAASARRSRSVVEDFSPATPKTAASSGSPRINQVRWFAASSGSNAQQTTLGQA
jgi:hypothetical protein